MSNSIARILLLLASSEISPRELRDFARWVVTSKEDRMLRSVMDLRSMARSNERGPSYSALAESDTSINKRSSYSEGALGGVVDKVEQLLINEAGLSKKEAAFVLREQLERQLGSDFLLPSENKIAFSSWIERLAAIIPGSQLIHVATKIRNSYVHSDKSDWPLVR